MALSVWEVFLALFRDGETSEEASEDAADGDDSGRRFVPSPLDLSVRIGHGGAESQRVRELADVQERAREIEAEQHED